MGLSEADTCRKSVLPRLLTAGWDNDPRSIAKQSTFTKVDELKRLQAETQNELDALMPSILDRAFKGEL